MAGSGQIIACLTLLTPRLAFNIGAWTDYDDDNNPDESNSYINGYIHNSDVDLSDITVRLDRIGVNGGEIVSGDIYLEFSHNPEDDSVNLSRIQSWLG